MPSFYKIYMIYPNQRCYSGRAYVAAESVEEANRFLAEFRQEDRKDNQDSYGYGCAEEHKIMPNLFSDIKGIVDYGIWYNGG